MAKARIRNRAKAGKPLTLAAIRRIAFRLPGVEEGPCYGTPGFRVRKKLLARLKEDGESLVVKVDFDQREVLMEADPDTYFITDHYRNSAMVQVRLANARADEVATLLEAAWRKAAPRKLIKELDGEE